MRINGYKLREAMTRFELQRDSVAAQFKGSLHAFEDEKKESPDSLMNTLSAAECAIASLQTAQARYNLEVKVPVQGTVMSLCKAIKLMGGATRVENLWKVAAGTKKEKGAYYDRGEDLVRNTDQVTAKSVLQPKERLERATKAAQRSAALRSAVAQGNAVEMEIDLDSKLLVEG